jgi:pyruvate dehydrogenase kinase 2/3/4
MNISKHVDRYSKYSPSPLSVQQFLDFASTTDNEQKSVEYLRYELPTRLANMLKEMHRLPKELLETPSFEMVKNMYEETLEEVLVFERKNTKDLQVRQEFIESLSSIVNRHRSVVEEVAKGVLEYKAYVIDGGIPAIEEEKMQYFLDRFYMSRIAIRVLINQHVTMFGDRGSLDNSLVGAFDGKCDLRRVVEDAAQNAQYLCEKYYLGAPEVEIEMVNDRKYIEMGYVPSHLHHICFELFKNSMRATVESHSDTFDVPPIRVLLTKGKDNVCIKISDRGGGASLDECRRWTHYMYSTAPPPEKTDDGRAPLAGYGYGIPLSRLYARYLGGDLMLQSVEGYGTDAYIYLKSGTADAVEVLPIFTNQLSDHYKTQRTMKDWVSKQGPISTSQLNTSMSSGGHRKF